VHLGAVNPTIIKNRWYYWEFSQLNPGVNLLGERIDQVHKKSRRHSISLNITNYQRTIICPVAASVCKVLVSFNNQRGDYRAKTE